MRIHPLPPEVRSKIAAGEVIERPASVVKELVENSIDAGARNISIEVKDGGKTEIKVTDDGCGIHSSEVEAAFERYSTSKISTLDDLERISTLGFRGEALASIAAAAGEVEMITRSAEEDAGTQAYIVDGKVVKKNPVGAPRGTIVIVRNLFERIPARKKFMKNPTVEMSHITETVIREAFTYPEISFKLIHEKVTIFSTSGKGLYDTISTIYGSGVGRALVPVGYETRGLRISGYVSLPPEFRRSTGFMTVIVNSRYVESTWIKQAVRMGYKTLIPEGFYPIAVIRIDLDTREVDVNIHPRKLEVKISNETIVAEGIRDAVWNAISRQGTKLMKGKTIPKKEEKPARTEASPEKDVSGLTAEPYESETKSILTPRETPVPEFHVVAQVFDTFMLVVKGDELLIVDQHVAHERVLYERMQDPANVQAQRLLVPFVVELSPRDIVTFQAYREAMQRLGFEFEEFGERCIRVISVPKPLAGPITRETIENIIDDLGEEGKSRDIEEAMDRVRKVSACRSAIMAGDRISPEFFRTIFRDLLHTKNPYTCPHGRPIFISMKKEKLEREFGR